MKNITNTRRSVVVLWFRQKLMNKNICIILLVFMSSVHNVKKKKKV